MIISGSIGAADEARPGVIYVWPAHYTGIEQVTIDYYLAGIDSPSFCHWIVPGTGYF